MLKLCIFYLNSDADCIIDPQLTKSFVKNSLDQPNWDTTVMMNITDANIQRTACLSMAYASVFADEMINHNKHMWSRLISKSKDASNWKKDKFWDIVTQYLNKKHPNNMDLNKLPRNKKGYFFWNIGKPEVLHKIYVWIKTNDIMSELRSVGRKNNSTRKNVRISLPMMAFFLELAKYLHSQYLGSRQQAQDDGKCPVRDFTLDDTVNNWLHRSYQNVNGLMNTLVFHGWSDANKAVYFKIMHGIVPELDLQIKVKKIVEDADAQEAIIYHMVMMRIKFLMFYPILAHAINGVWWFGKFDVHLPMQLIYTTTENILHAHYCNLSTKPIIGKSDDHRPNYLQDDDCKNASPNQRRVWKVKQIMQVFIHNWCQHTKHSGIVMPSVISMNDQHNFWSLPISAAWTTFAWSGIKCTSGSCWSTVSRNVRNFNFEKWKKDTKKTNQSWCDDYYTTYLKLPKDEIEEIRTEIVDVIENEAKRWNAQAHNAFPSDVTKDFCNTVFWKQHLIKPARAWKRHLPYEKRHPRLIHNNIYYGTEWLQMNSKQQDVRISPTFATCSIILRRRKWTVVDDGVVSHYGNCNPIDCDSEKELMTNQTGTNTNTNVTNVHIDLDLSGMTSTEEEEEQDEDEQDEQDKLKNRHNKKNVCLITNKMKVQSSFMDSSSENDNDQIDHRNQARQELKSQSIQHGYPPRHTHNNNNPCASKHFKYVKSAFGAQAASNKYNNKNNYNNNNPSSKSDTTCSMDLVKTKKVHNKKKNQ